MPNDKKIRVLKRDKDELEQADAATMRQYYASLGEACELLIKRIETLEIERDQAIRQRDLADLNVAQQKEIVLNHITSSRQEEMAISTELIEMKAKVKKLEAKIDKG